MPYFEIASATLAAGSVPSSASAFSAATVMYQRSTSKKRRSFSRVSGAAEAIGAEDDITARHEFADLPGKRAHVVGRRNDRALGVGEPRRHMRRARRVGRMHHVPARRGFASRASSVNDGQPQMIGVDAPIRLEQFGRSDGLAQDHARAEQLDARRLVLAPARPAPP